MEDVKKICEAIQMSHFDAEGREIIRRAAAFANQAHDGTNRKGKKIPYIYHPAEVAGIVSEMTEDAEVVAAAFLHDVVEDTSYTAEDIRKEFGDRVTRLVLSESEDKRRERPADETWKIRKKEFLEHLPGKERDAKMIALADKLSNLRSLQRDYQERGEELWNIFNQKDPKEHAWYYGEVIRILEKDFPDAPSLQEMKQCYQSVFGDLT